MAMPRMSSSTTSTSPVWTAVPISSPSPTDASRSAIAQRTARAAPSKIARMPSPVVFTVRPRKTRHDVAALQLVIGDQPAPGGAAQSRGGPGGVDEIGEDERREDAFAERIERLEPLPHTGPRDSLDRLVADDPCVVPSWDVHERHWAGVELSTVLE